MDFKQKLEEELRKDMFIQFCMFLGRGMKPLCPYCHKPIINPSVRSRTCGSKECKKKYQADWQRLHKKTKRGSEVKGL